MGAMALFGENYGDEVRVVEIGYHSPWSYVVVSTWSILRRSAHCGLGESSVGSGVRRIEAYTGMDSFRFLSGGKNVVADLAANLKTPSEELPERIDALTAKLKAAEKQIQQMRNQQLLAGVGDLVAKAETIGGIKVVAVQLPEGVSAGDVRTMATDAKARFGSDAAVVFFTASDDGKVPFVAAVTDAAVDKGLKAGELVKTFGEKVAVAVANQQWHRDLVLIQQELQRDWKQLRRWLKRMDNSNSHTPLMQKQLGSTRSTRVKILTKFLGLRHSPTQGAGAG